MNVNLLHNDFTKRKLHRFEKQWKRLKKYGRVLIIEAQVSIHLNKLVQTFEIIVLHLCKSQQNC